MPTSSPNRLPNADKSEISLPANVADDDDVAEAEEEQPFVAVTSKRGRGGRSKNRTAQLKISPNQIRLCAQDSVDEDYVKR